MRPLRETAPRPSAIEAAGLRILSVRENPAYAFLSKSAQGASREYGVKSISLVAVKEMAR